VALCAMVPLALLLSLAAPAPLGRMTSLDSSKDYSQLEVTQVAPDTSTPTHAVADMHAVAGEDTSKAAASSLLKAAKAAEAEKRKAGKDSARAEAREQLKAQKEREHALQKAQADEEKRNAEARKLEAKSASEEAQPLVRSTADVVDPHADVNWAQEKRKADRAEALQKLKAQKEKERSAQKEANKAERSRLQADAREAQKRLADAQHSAVGGSVPAEEAPAVVDPVKEVIVGKPGAAERAEAKAQAKTQRDSEKAAARAQNDEEKARAKAQNEAERARAKEQTEELKKDNEKQRFREAAGRYEAAIKTTERVAEQKRAGAGPKIPVQAFDDTGRCPVVGSCGGGDLGVMPDTENNDAGALPDDAGPLCVGSDCNGGGGSATDGKKDKKKNKNRRQEDA